MIDFAEAVVLENHVGEVFSGFVVDVDDKRGRARIQIVEPAIVAPVPAAGRRLAEEVNLELSAVDTADRSVTFDVVD